MPRIHLLLVFLVSIPQMAFADYGLPALRLYCSMGSDTIEIEPYIAWNDNNSRFKEFQVEQAGNTCCHHPNSDTSFFSYAWKEQYFIHTPCSTKTRNLDVFVVRDSITVVEGDKSPIHNHEIGYVWHASGSYSYLRSTNEGSWEICEGSEVKKDEPMVCKSLTNHSTGPARKSRAGR